MKEREGTLTARLARYRTTKTETYVNVAVIEIKGLFPQPHGASGLFKGCSFSNLDSFGVANGWG